jgi:tRNA A-37 threonylcarbamoyl transferase component Bud32
MPSSSANTPGVSFADYRVVRALGESSYLCLAPGDRYVVTKPLDEDCLLSGGLHQAIKERLARVRELAHAGVANLYGVERDDAGRAWLVWEHVPGEPLADLVNARRSSPRELWVVLRETVLAVEALHARGIVHGAIHERNVIVEGARAVRLTHISPLLYTDASDDEEAVLDLLERFGADANNRLSEVMAGARGQRQPLRRVRSHLSSLIESRQATPGPVENASDVEPSGRRVAMIAAGLVAVLGIGLAYGLMHFTTSAVNPGPDTSSPVRPD